MCCVKDRVPVKESCFVVIGLVACLGRRDSEREVLFFLCLFSLLKNCCC
jgi:hypothetical protein